MGVIVVRFTILIIQVTQVDKFECPTGFILEIMNILLVRLGIGALPKTHQVFASMER